jgi:protein-L-isoaspartate(D-aspartate) O-methyltransferase
MVRDQLEARGIKDERVLEAFRTVPRHEFVNPSYRDQAYADRALPTQGGQTISQPYMVATMTEKLDLDSNLKMLEIGTGSGYQTAILREIGGIVYTVEKFGELSERARRTLRSLGYDEEIYYRVGDGTRGWERQAPYQRILVTAGAPDVPEPLKSQADDDARIVIPVGSKSGQTLRVLEQTNGGPWSTTDHTRCVFVPLTGSEGWEETDEQ